MLLASFDGFAFLSCAVVDRLQELALSLSLKCLSFDFVGTSIDESSEEFGTVQVFTCFCFSNEQFELSVGHGAVDCQIIF